MEVEKEQEVESMLTSESSETFFDHMNSLLSVKRDYENKELNKEWMDRFEDVLPYLDNILRNPKRFIINEEEIVKVELARKVTVESVIHLTQHTNLIQDFDQKSGDVRPSKILNINKEESLDTYENRFIYTLIHHMNAFYEQRSAGFKGDSSFYEKVDMKYEASTKVGNEDVKVAILLSSNDQNQESGDSTGTDSIENRLKKIKIQLNGFATSELMQTLNKLHVPQVRSPIRKTNLILKNPNFQKATELWNFIQSFTEEDYQYEKDHQDYMDSGELKRQFDQAFLVSYLATDTIGEKQHPISEKKAISLSVGRLVESLLDFDENITSDMIQEIFQKELVSTKKKIAFRNQLIKKAFLEKFQSVDQEILNLYTILE